MDTSEYVLMTMSALIVFVGIRSIFSKTRRDMAQLTVIVIGTGPIGVTLTLIAVQCKRVRKLVLYEDHTRSNIEKRSYQIAIQSKYMYVQFLKGFGVDFDNL
jgi:threonine dehydrogenase-like Zn-dependent dehydrogenase